MIIKHIALTVKDRKEIQNFYIDILGLRIEREYQLGEEYAKAIFGIKTGPVDVVLAGNDRIMLEFFIYADKVKSTFEHICIALENRDLIFSQSQSNGYGAIRIERDGNDILFISDSSGNTFELKNI